MNYRQLFLTVLEAGKTKVKVLSDSVPDEGSLPDLQMMLFQCPHMTEREKASSLVYLFVRTLIPSWDPILMTSSNLKYLSKSTSPISFAFGVWIWEFGLKRINFLEGGGIIQSIARRYSRVLNHGI